MGTDDDIIRGGGEFKEWLSYRIWGMKGQWFVALALVLGFVAGALVF